MSYHYSPCTCGRCSPCIAARTEANTEANRTSPYDPYAEFSPHSSYTPTFPTPDKRATVPLPPTTPHPNSPVDLPPDADSSNEDAAAWLLGSSPQIREPWSDQPGTVSLPIASGSHSPVGRTLQFPNPMHRKTNSAPPLANDVPFDMRRWSATPSTSNVPWTLSSQPQQLPTPSPTRTMFQPPPAFERREIHPLLDGTGHGSGFIYNLASSGFSAGRIPPADRLTTEELKQQAIRPAVSSVRVTCRSLPQWKMDIPYTRHHHRTPRSEPIAIPGLRPAPIGLTVEDVLRSISVYFRTQITADEWKAVTRAEKDKIAHAYRRRCAGNEQELAKGIRRCDFLLDAFMFRSLVWETDGLTNGLSLILDTTSVLP